jgi:hypothetical protein
MQPPTRGQLEAALARAKQAGRSKDVASLEAMLKDFPNDPPPATAPVAQTPTERVVVKRMIGFGPPEHAERDERSIGYTRLTVNERLVLLSALDALRRAPDLWRELLQRVEQESASDGFQCHIRTLQAATSTEDILRISDEVRAEIDA